MGKFDPNSECIKCGSKCAYVEYRRTVNHNYSIDYEIMIRRCEVCGYEWYEEPLDKITT
jgi:DNA-directed RNA polymerase subunit M/transcription elongation factor TFIIS